MKKERLTRYIFFIAILCISLAVTACGSETDADYTLSVGASSFHDDEKFANHIIFKIWDKLGYETEIIEIKGSFDGCARLNSAEILTSVISQGACYKYMDDEATNENESYGHGLRAGIVAGVKYLQAWTLSPDIVNYQDFEGKRIFVGNENGISAFFLSSICNVLGIKHGEFVYGSFDEANEFLTSGKVDAVFGCISKNSAALETAIKDYRARLVFFTPIQIEMILDEVKLLQKMTIPAGTFGRYYQNDIVTLGDYQIYCFNDEVPEELVYFFVKGYYEYLSSAKLSQSDIYWKSSSLSDVENIVIPLHLGAYRYFTEKGANINNKAFPTDVIRLDVKPEE